MSSLVNSFKASRLAQIGLVLLVVGAVCKFFLAADNLPKRSDLKAFEGVLSEATRTTRSSAKRGVTSVVFSMKFVGAAGQEPLMLTLPSTEITQDQVVSMLQQRVKVEYDGEREVYAMASGGKEVIAYDATIGKRTSNMQYWTEKGTFYIIGALHLIVIGWFLTARAAKKQKRSGEIASA